MHCQNLFSGENIIRLSSAELAQRGVKINVPFKIVDILQFFFFFFFFEKTFSKKNINKIIFGRKILVKLFLAATEDLWAQLFETNDVVS